MHKAQSLLKVKDLDLGQALIRFFLSLGVLCYTGWYDSQPGSDPLMFPGSIGFFLFAAINLMSFWLFEVPVLLRRAISISVDIGIVTFAAAVFGEAATPFVGGYLWVTIANGLRFGQGYLYVAGVLSIAGFIFVLLNSSYWQEQTTMGLGILIWMILLPLYFSKLLSNLEQVIEREKKANSIKSEFMANMSHELRTPLNAIIGYSEMLIEDAEKSGDKVQYSDLVKIRHAAHLLLNLINSVLDLSKIEAGIMEVYIEDVDVHHLAFDVCELIKPQVEKNNSTLSIDLEQSLGAIKTDYIKIKQILLNLMSNAAKFTHNGEVKLEMRLVDEAKEPYIEIKVVDTGIGMDEQSIDRLFEPFTQADTSTTRKYGGTGLGLTITKGFVEMLHGELHVESKLGEGTVFTVFLPCDFDLFENSERHKNIENKNRLSASHGGELKRKKSSKVLLVESESNMQEGIVQYLSEAGFDIDVANTGQEALKLLQYTRPDVIAMDIVLPDMDGMSLLSAVKQAVADDGIPIVVLSMTDDADVIKCEGICAYVEKPDCFEDIEHTLVKCVRRKV